jgi:hypothetical protein
MGERFDRLMWSLLAAGATDFVETGSGTGRTSGAVAREFDLPVWTCEIDPDFAHHTRDRLFGVPPWAAREFDSNLIAAARQKLAGRVHFYEMPSEEFLPLIIPELGDLPLFFLDAHSDGHYPLRDELRTITGECDRTVVLVHDFKVPGRGMSEFRYDYYDGDACDFDYILPALADGHGYRFFVPAYAPPEGRRHTGYVLIFQDVEPVGDLGDLAEWKR